MKHRMLFAALLVTAVLGSGAVPATAAIVKVNGYLEYRKTAYLIVDGQRIATTSRTRFKGSGAAKSIATIPIGYEVKAEGTRQADGTLTATKLEAKANGMATYEGDVMAGTNQAEQAWVKAGKIVEQGEDGKEVSMGNLKSKGPEVDRARRIVDRILPSYIDPKKVRVYVVDNKEWNAMAMANYSIYVFSGLMKDMDDDELAIVLGHEIAHASYEHSRRQAVKGLWSGIAGTAAAIGASQFDSKVARDAATVATGLSVSAFNNNYSRDYEDQADRVGLRYVYEAGYDYKKAPGLWRKFAAKYGDRSEVENFFFGNHSLSTKRAAALEKEIKNNYHDPAKDPPTKSRVAAR